VSPTVRRRELGGRLRELRHQAELTVEQASEVLLCSAAKISRIETGDRGVSVRDVRDLCEAYQVDQAARDHLMVLVRESKQPTWWQDLDLEGLYKKFIGFEEAAQSINDYESGVVPGLLQTREYALASIQGMVPSISPEQKQQSMEARLTRQRILTRENPVRYQGILDEAVLRRVVGGPAVMRGQLAALAERAALPNVTIQVIPFDAGAHPGQDSTFMLLEFDDPTVDDVIYVEGLAGIRLLDRPTELDRYTEVFDELRDIALDPEPSINLIELIGSSYQR
jgi:transcriptional regulator with XRE-family HTH domain